MPRVLIVEDDAATREGLARLLTRHGYEVSSCAEGQSALEAARQNNLDVVLLDLILPGVPGLELLRRLRAYDATLPIVVLTGEGTLANAIAALRHDGAFDFLRKPVTDVTVLQAAISKAYAHGLAQREAQGTGVGVASRTVPQAIALSEREMGLLRMVARGYANERIAEEACLSAKTVRNYLSILYDKLGVENRTQAAILFRTWEPQ